MLILAILGSWPYRFYQVLRTVICLTAIFLALLARKQRRDSWFWIFVAITAAFNPFVPLYLGRETWVLIDLISLALFLIAINKLGVKQWRSSNRRKP